MRGRPSRSNPPPCLVGPWVGRKARTLAPHAPRLTVTPLGEIPARQLRLPAGFQAEVYAHGMPGARMMAVGNGTIFVGTRTIGRVYAVSRNQGGSTRSGPSPQASPSRTASPSETAALYVLAINRVLRFDNIEGKLDNPPARRST